MTTIFLCDDEVNLLEHYSELITKTAHANDVSINLHTFSNANELLFAYEDYKSEVDILYLDILMDNLNGMDAAKKLRDMGCQAQIVFLTSSEQHVYEAFDVNPIQYLIKDKTSYETFEKVFIKAVSLADKNKNDVFTFDASREKVVIRIIDILYFEVWRRKIIVHCIDNKKYDYYGRMEELESSLGDTHCVRVHRSYIVNMRYVSSLKKSAISLRNGEQIPVGVTYLKRLEKSFINYFENR